MLNLLSKYIKLTTQNKINQQEGLTLVELLIVVIIVGILSAISFSSLHKFIDKARYADAQLDMDCIADDARSVYLETGRFPADIGNNRKPTGINCFPIAPNDYIPFNSRYDYESWSASGRCYIQVTFFGKNGVRNSPTNRANFPTPGMYDDYDDDMILSLGIFDVPCQ